VRLAEALRSFDVLTVAMLVLMAGVYARGWAQLRRRMPRRFGWPQLVAFLAGLDVLFVALAPPLDVLAAESLTVHMTQHLLLMMVAPPLLWLGAPLAPLLRGLPQSAMRVAISFLAWAPVKHGGRALTHPALDWALFTALGWAWHVPAAYELALRSHGWHHLEHACFLGSALLFWWPVVQPWPSRPRWPRWAMIPYLVLAEIQNTLLAAVFTFAGRVLYPTYAATAARLGTSALEDQTVAGLIMWGPGSLIILIPAGWLVVRMLAPTRMTRNSAPPETRPMPRSGAMMR
jgi:cytochrome c oxidase assembly factor CtaG